MDADAWNQRYAERDVVWGIEPNRFVAADLADLPAGRALDVACGEGRNAIWLASRGWAVTALDFSSVAIDKARRLAEHEGVTVDWRVADATTWTPDDGSQFDLVLWSYLQLSGDDRANALRHAVACVAPGGTFLLVAHDARNVTDGVGGPKDATVCYRADDVVVALGDAFDVVKAGEVVRPATLDDGTTGDAIDCLVRAVCR